VAAYDTSPTTFPLLDIANRYTLVGSSFTPSVLNNLSQAQIVASLSEPTSPVTQAVVAAANEITAAICSVDGERPGAVCSARGVVAADQKMQIPGSGAGSG
jgi:adenosine/AMP kinase